MAGAAALAPTPLPAPCCPLQAWPNKLQSVLAVEPSLSMLQLGQRLELSRRWGLAAAGLEPPLGLAQQRLAGVPERRLAVPHKRCCLAPRRQRLSQQGLPRQRLRRTASTWRPVAPPWPWPPTPAPAPALRRAAHDTSPRVSWVRSLPDFASVGKLRGRHDLVVASYVLGEMGSSNERERLVRQLWEMAGDVLVLIEPGGAGAGGGGAGGRATASPAAAGAAGGCPWRLPLVLARCAVAAGQASRRSAAQQAAPAGPGPRRHAHRRRQHPGGALVRAAAGGRQAAAAAGPGPGGRGRAGDAPGRGLPRRRCSCGRAARVSARTRACIIVPWCGARVFWPGEAPAVLQPRPPRLPHVTGAASRVAWVCAQPGASSSAALPAGRQPGAGRQVQAVRRARGGALPP
jgi:hypothetical protein